MRFRSSPAPMPYESGVWGTPDNPCPSERTLAAHVDGELDGTRAATLESHLDACPACASDHRRLEGLSGLLRGWDAQMGRPDVPPRLAARVLRDVTAEGGALRVETRRASRRSALAAAAVVIVVVSAWIAGRVSTDLDRAGAVHGADVVWAQVTFPSDVAREPLAVPVPVSASRSVPQFVVPALETGRERLLAALSAQDRNPHSSVFADGASREAFAKWLPALDVERRIGEAVCLFDGRAIPTWALPEYERVRRLEGWIAARARRAIEADTRDPSATGKPVTDWLPFTDGGAVASFFHGGARRAVDRATPSHGSVVLRAIPGRAGSTAEGAAKDGASATSPRALDLLAAVGAGHVRFLPDVAGDPTGERMEVALEVSIASPGVLVPGVLVPAGELIAGGAGDRVVARGAWLRPSASPYVVRLPCRPLSRAVGKLSSKSEAPAAFGAVAGPELRALLAVLATGEAGVDDARAVLSLADAQLRDAGFPVPEEGESSSLLDLYRETSAAARAREMVDSLGDGAVGFVATDLDGRFQGIERIDLPAVAARATLERLVAGYLLEARSRSSADAPRLGVHAEALLGKLSERPLRLSPQRGATLPSWTAVEPRTGLLLQGLPGDEDGIPLLSGHVPVFR